MNSIEKYKIKDETGCEFENYIAAFFDNYFAI